nr:hypothetical protein [uncultured Rhodopila sp.]
MDIMPEKTHGFTPEREELLSEFADQLMAVRMLMRWIVWASGGISLVVAILYYALGAWISWRVLRPPENQ